MARLPSAHRSRSVGRRARSAAVGHRRQAQDRRGGHRAAAWLNNTRAVCWRATCTAASRTPTSTAPRRRLRPRPGACPAARRDRFTGWCAGWPRPPILRRLPCYCYGCSTTLV